MYLEVFESQNSVGLCLFLYKVCCKLVWKFCEIWILYGNCLRDGPNSVRFYLTVWDMACMDQVTRLAEIVRWAWHLYLFRGQGLMKKKDTDHIVQSICLLGYWLFAFGKISHIALDKAFFYFLITPQNIHCEYWLVSHWGAWSLLMSTHMFSWRNNKNLSYLKLYTPPYLP